MAIEIRSVKEPTLDHSGQSVHLSDETMEARRQKLLTVMKQFGFSSLVIYADKEHGSNFEYLTGFIPRFEEGLLVLNQDGSCSLLLGNENYNKVKFSRILATGIKCPLLSLPNQPMDFSQSMAEYLKLATIDSSGKVGLAGWKLLSPSVTDDTQTFDVPEFIVTELKELVGQERVVNGTHLLIDPSIGARVTNNANEIAHYEYGASLASDSVLTALNALKPGLKETEAGDLLTKNGQYQSVVTIAAFGDRFVNANLYPTEKALTQGDKVALTVAYKGGLSSRSGYAVENETELEDIAPGYLTEVVKPYFSAYQYWLETLEIGLKGGAFFEKFADFYPPTTFGWDLCPGHLVADEEWLSSPFYPNSPAVVASGMIFQIDFIPIQPGFSGISAESTIAIADDKLRQEIERDYPELWQRIETRRAYLKNELNIHLSKELLPLCSTVGYLRPFLLNGEEALVVS